MGAVTMKKYLSKFEISGKVEIETSFCCFEEFEIKVLRVLTILFES